MSDVNTATLNTGIVGIADDGRVYIYEPPVVIPVQPESLPISGGTLTGPLNFASGNNLATIGFATGPFAIGLNGVSMLAFDPVNGVTALRDPIVPLGLATKEYVDAAVGGGIPEAPTNGQVYGRQGSTASWLATLPLTGGTLSNQLTVTMTAPNWGSYRTPLVMGDLTMPAISGPAMLFVNSNTTSQAIALFKYNSSLYISYGTATTYQGDIAWFTRSATTSSFSVSGQTSTQGLVVSVNPSTFNSAATFNQAVTFGAGSTLMLAQDPTAPLQAATKQYVDNAVAGGVAGVASFNTRTGIVTLTAADVTGVGGALAANVLALSGGTVTGATTFSAAGTGVTLTGNQWIQGGNLTLGTGGNNQIVLQAGAGAGTVATINTAGTAGLAVTGTGGLLAGLINAGRSNTVTWAGATPSVAPLVVLANVAGASTNTSESAFLGTFSGSSANVNAPSLLVDGVNIGYNVGGAAAAAAQWNGLSINLNDGGSSTNDKAAGTQGAFVALQVARRASRNQGGTGLTSGTCFGQNWGIDIVNSTYSGATNIGLLNGLEINQAIQTGSSVFRRADIQLSPSNAHQVRGIYDYGMVVLLSATSNTPYRNGITFGGGLSPVSPLGTDGVLLSMNFAQNVTATAGIGIDFNDATFTTAAIRAPGFTVDNVGTVRVGTGYISSTGTGLAIDAKGSVGTGTPTVNAGGTGWLTNDYADDAYGGTYRITATSGAITSVIVLTQPYANTTSPPATLALTARIGGQLGTATGGVLNASWSSTRTTLALNPSGGATRVGGTIGFNNTTPIAKPVVTGAKGSNAALASLMTALAAYGLVTDNTTA